MPIIWQTVPVLYITTKIVEPVYIVYSGLEYLVRTSAGIVTNVAAKASPVNCTLDFAVAT
jgi:hypothetical protein